jgi:hypothetical protein
MIFVIVAFASHTNGKISLPRDLSWDPWWLWTT